MVETLPTTGLQLRRSKGWIALALVPVLVLVGVGAWFARHPTPLVTSDQPATVSAPIGIAVYVGVYRLPADADRTLHVSDVAISDTGNADVALAPVICHGGALSTTTVPSTFCPELEAASGALLRPGDQLVVQVTGESAGTTTVARPLLSYRDGLQWATQAAGRPIEVTVLTR